MSSGLILTVFLIFPSINFAFECDEHAQVCETSLNIEYRLPMMTPANGPVYPYNGKLYPYDISNLTNAPAINMADIITADGHESSWRLVVSANGSLPGPPIIVYEGQTVIVHVYNLLKSESITIHWHGLDQHEQPWMDGAPYITQCPISPGQKFTYKFKAFPSGTMWYHSHMGHQRLNGLFGAFIVREKGHRLPEHILQVFEWNHDYDANTDDMMEELNAVYRDRKQLPRYRQLDKIPYTVYNTHSGLFNGRGRFWNSSTSNNGAPLETFTVQAGQQYRFRVIATGAIFPWRISVDNHNITIISTDGFGVNPIVAESIIISPGERYDFILEANQPAANYWIRGEALERTNSIRAEAILHYYGTTSCEPTSKKAACTNQNQCLVVNCPFPFYPENDQVTCLRISDLRSDVGPSTPKAVNGKFKEYFLNFAFPGENGEHGGASINGIASTLPTVSALTQPTEITNQCSDVHCQEGKLCKCFNSLTINSGDTIQMTFLNIGQGLRDDHPIHMHGHAFLVIKVGYGVFNKTTGKFIRQNDDIVCTGVMCNNATWRNSTWLDGNVPDIVERGAVIKDTVNLPSGGYVTVRFPATLPGLWFLHCHIDLHSNDGMAMVLNESFADIPKQPQNFPQCRNFEL